MAIRIDRGGVTPFGNFGQGDLVYYLPPHQENLLIEMGHAARISSGIAEVQSEQYLVGADGTLYPLAWVVGTIEEGMIAGAPQALIQVDSGSDTADHAQILWTANCLIAGNPGTPDSALASTRFAAYATDAEVYKSAVDGQASGEAFALRYPALYSLHFALAGGGSYTVAAGNVLTGTQMVLMTFPEEPPVVAAEIRLMTAQLGTSGYRYRKLVVTPYGAA